MPSERCRYNSERGAESSTTLTGLIIGSIFRALRGNLLVWDFRPDCRKQHKKLNDYSGCMGLSYNPKECAQNYVLGMLLLAIAEKEFSITITEFISMNRVVGKEVPIPSDS